jgi:general secretion pathway protein G
LILALRERRLLHRQRGFTLIELLVVLAILAILAAIVTFGVITFLKNANLSACKQEKSTVQAAMDSMMAANNVTQLNAQTIPVINFATYPTAPTGQTAQFLYSDTTAQSFLRTKFTKYGYIWDSGGKVQAGTFAGDSTAVPPQPAVPMPDGCN